VPARSTRVFLANQTIHTLSDRGYSLAHGAWTNDVTPPAQVGPGTVGYWESESDGLLTGTEGHISFTIGAATNARAPIAAISRDPDQLDIFFVGQDGYVYTAAWNAANGWSEFWNIGGVFPPGAPVAVVSRNPNQLDVFVIGNDGCVYTSAWTAGGNWTGIGNRWWNIGGVFPNGAPLAVVSRNPNQLDVFVTGNDGCVYTSAWTAGGNWTGIGNHWWNIGGVFPTGAPLSAVSRNPNQLDLFIIGNDGSAYTSAWTNGGTWTGIGNKWFGFSKSLYFHWDNPYSGQNKYNLFISSGYQCFRDSGAGNNADVHVTLRPAVRHDSGFLPSVHGWKFVNHWGNVPYTLPPLRGSILDYKYGNAVNGLCGGMVYTARDFFEARLPIPSNTTPPLGEQDPLFIAIVNRLFDTFDIDDVTLYLKYMNPAYPDTDENVASSLGLADGRASVVINTEWPMIRQDIDGGSPACLGLVTIKSLNPGDLGHCHQVLAYAYLEDGNNVTLWIYDPNQPDDDNVTIAFSTLDWSVPIQITHNVDVTENGQKLPIYCLFRTNYKAKVPTAAELQGAAGS
jgi:hypothetical protein